jgi:hypothetical protein
MRRLRMTALMHGPPERERVGNVFLTADAGADSDFDHFEAVRRRRL